MKKLTRVNAFTVDVEDGVCLSMRDYFNKNIAPTNRVESNTKLLLDLLEEHEVFGTFFILGDVALQFPRLVREIYSRGHEIGIHSLTHRPYFSLSYADVLNEVSTAKAIMEELTGEAVLGHRAPAFSINASNSWALSAIAEAGFKYDSSIMPAKTRRYGWPEFSKDIVRLNLPDQASLLEIPLSVYDIAGKAIPACGGGYLKFFPYWLTDHFMERIQERRMAMVYLHPYEVDTERYPDFFMQEAAKSKLKTRLKVGTFKVNKKTVKPKLERLIVKYSFAPLRDILKEVELSDIEEYSLLKKGVLQ